MRTNQVHIRIALAFTASCLLFLFQNCGAAKLEGNSLSSVTSPTDRLGASVDLVSLLKSPRENSTNILYPSQLALKEQGYSQDTPLMENLVLQVNDFDRIEWVHAPTSTIAAIGDSLSERKFSETTKGLYYVFGYRGETVFLIQEYELVDMGSTRLGVDSVNAIQIDQKIIASDTSEESVLLTVEAPSVDLNEIEFIFNNTDVQHSRRAILIKKKLSESLNLDIRLSDVSGKTLVRAIQLPAKVTQTSQACSFDGKQIADGASVTAFATESVPSESTCSSQTRTCTKGNLTGTYAHPSCVVLMPQACAFNGTAVSNGSSVTAYQSASVPTGSSCVSQTRTCNSGTLSGSYAFQTCTALSPKNCTFNGTIIAHGTAVTAYQAASVASGTSCAPQTRTCDNGTLSGTYQYASCSVQAPQNCSFNGSSVSHGASVTAYKASSVPYGSTCESQSRSCSNGSLAGTYSFSSCSVQAPLSCTFNGNTVAHGSSVTAYQSSSVPYGSSCLSQARTCSNGTLNGSYQSSSCSVQTPTATQVLKMNPSTLSVRAGQNLQVTIPFYGKPMADSYAIFIHFVDSNGVQAISNGGFPTPATSSWNGPINFTVSVPIPANIPTGVYTIRTGLYVYTPPYTTRISIGQGPGVTVDSTTRYTVGTVTINP